MLQRIQSVYLATAAIMVILGLVFAFFEASVTEDHEAIERVVVSANSIEYQNHETGETHTETPAYLLALTVFGFLIISGTVFFYKNRLLQVKLVRLSILLVAANLLLVFFYYSETTLALLGNEPDITEYGWSVYLGIVAMIFLFFAQKAIIRDEKLVRSANRLR